MPSNVEIDETLLNEALIEGGLKTKKATVHEALREFVERRKQLRIIELFGTVDFDPEFDHKKGRRRRCSSKGIAT